MYRLLPLALLVVGCTESACPEGTVQTAGGDCVEGEIETLAWEEGVIPGLQTRECVLKDNRGELDFVNACALGGCVGDTYEEIIDAWGVGADCSLGELGRQGSVCVENTKSQEYKLLGQISENMSADESD
ncbi:MAG: hypothetical protein AB8H79_00870 [Myxococcota bacterium]